VGLRVQRDAADGALAGPLEQGFQERGAHAAPAPFAEDRHPADPAVGKQPRRSDRFPAGITRDGVLAALVPFVQFELARNLLLLDEHLFPDRARQRQGFGPGKNSDGERCGHFPSV